MAIFHLSVKIISRGKGRSAVAAAAYRAGEKITNEYDGMIHDYTRKGGVVHTEILLPAHAPKEYLDRSTLWNAVEKIENNRNSQLSREIQIALPIELSMEQNIALAHDYVRKHFVAHGMIADICVHEPNEDDLQNGDDDSGSSRNPHAHIMLTMRPIEQDGSWGAKSYKEYILDKNGERIRLLSGEFKSRKVYTENWNDRERVEEWRAGWADMLNKCLEQNGITQRVDHRSFERQNLDEVPTIHLGVAASQMERKGIRTERGDYNRQSKITNKEIRQTKARIRKVKDWLYAQPINNAPSLMEVMSKVAEGKNLNTHWQKIKNLQASAKVLKFLSENNITSVEGFADKVIRIHERLRDVANEIKSKERRLSKLAEHLVHAENNRKYKGVYQKYSQLSEKKRDAFYDKHSEQIQLYQDAKRHFDAVMNGRTKLPIKDWQAEQKDLLAERYLLCEEYYNLKDEVRSVEVLRRGLEELLWEEATTESQKIIQNKKYNSREIV